MRWGGKGKKSPRSNVLVLVYIQIIKKKKPL